MAKIFPAGKTLQVKHLQDFLGKTRCVFDLANHPASILSFVAEINEGTRVYQGELDYAKEKGFIDTVQKEAVTTLMNRITAKAGDTDAQPVSVRARLRARILFSGKPTDIEDFIMKLLTEANFISEANYEMMACGMNYRPIGKVGDREGGRNGANTQLPDPNRVKVKLGAAANTTFVCNGCGAAGHKYKLCPHDKHDDFNSGKLPWASSEAGKRLAAAGKTQIPDDKKAGDKAIKAKKVKALLDTGAVVGNYCSIAVGEWTRQHFPQCWSDTESTESVDLATNGSSTEPLGSICIDINLTKID
ncbi:hypothetical protein B484DRAFT_426023, partial [Ochromonadaceae sp. CCMP2298]